MTIAPAEPASATPPATPADDGRPGTALLRTLTELTADLPDADPGRVAAAALRGRSARADVAELRELATEAAAGLISEDPAYSQLAARLLTLSIPAEAASQGVTLLLRVGRRRPPRGPDRGPHRRVRTAARGPPGRSLIDREAPTTASATSGCAPCTAATSAAPDHPPGHRDARSTSCCASRAGSPRTSSTRPRAGRSRRALPPDEPPRLPAVLPHALQLRHPAPPDVVLLPPRLPAGRAGLHLRPLPPGRPPLQARGRHRPRRTPASAPAVR